MDGSCICLDGWTGASCNLQTAECSNDDACGGTSRGQCVNGLCECHDGHSGPRCDPCEQGRFGSCQATCDEYVNCSGKGR